MEELKNEIDIREELLSLDEPPAPITWLLGGDDEKMERIAEHRLQLASIRKQYTQGMIIRFQLAIPQSVTHGLMIVKIPKGTEAMNKSQRETIGGLKRSVLIPPGTMQKILKKSR